MASLISSIAQFLYPLRKRVNSLFGGGSISSPDQLPVTATSIYNFRFKGINGNTIELSKFRGKKMLLVNTASECGFTPQYAGLQQLQEKYPEKLVVIGFPSNNFGAQEPGSEKEISEFCSKNYGVTFPLSAKMDVTGDNQHELFRWLTKKELNGWNDRDPNWNFCKYLVDENGKLINFFSSKLDPLDEKIVSAIH